MAREDEIRLIAYTIWEEEGCVHGHDCEHWIKAETIWEEKEKQKASPVAAPAKSKTAARKSSGASAKKTKA